MVDVIIPTYQPDDDLIRLFDSLRKQTANIGKIIVMNTEEGEWEKYVLNHRIKPEDYDIEIHHISKREFGHGKTRNRGVKYSNADIFILMTQDAVPADEYFAEKLIEPLSDEKTAASYARQLAKEDASTPERITRQFNYPEESMLKSAKDIEALGIKTYFCSNVACAYRRDVFDSLGGFVNRTIFNEDMIYAAGAVKAGYNIAYAADARVYHSHNYSGRDQFHRNVDLGVSQAEHPEIFADVPSEGEGKKMVSVTVKELFKMGEALKVIPYIYVCACRYVGYKIGKNYKRLPVGFVKKCSTNPKYFDK